MKKKSQLRITEEGRKAMRHHRALGKKIQKLRRRKGLAAITKDIAAASREVIQKELDTVKLPGWTMNLQLQQIVKRRGVDGRTLVIGVHALSKFMNHPGSARRRLPYSQASS